MSFFTARRYGACTLVLVIASNFNAAAADLSSTASLSLEQAVDYSLRNSQLTSLGYQTGAAEGRLQQARLKPNPELSLRVEDLLGTGDFSGIDSAETTLSIAWVLERGSRNRRIDSARARVALSSADVNVARMDVAAETARRFLELLAFQAHERVADENIKLATNTVAAVSRRVRAGRTPRAELQRARADLALAELQREDIQHEKAAARRLLAAQWQSIEPEFNSVQGDLEVAGEVISYERLRDSLELNPEVARLLTQERLAEAELYLAEAAQRPDWALSVGVRRFESSNDHALTAGISVPLTWRNRNQGGIATARADIERSRSQQAATRVELDTRLFVLYESMQHARHRSEVLTNKVIPRLQNAAAETRRAYEQGRYGYFEWRSVRSELVEARHKLLEARVDAYKQAIEIERITGVQIAQTGDVQ